jgi:hypothetical protein
LRAVRFWRWPLLAVCVTLIAIVILAALALKGGTPKSDATPPADISGHLKTGQQALSSGKFILAAEEFQTALDLREHHPNVKATLDGRQLAQLYRQASLLSELISEPLDDILREAAEATETDPREWQAAFARRYRGRAVVFDAEVSRDAQGTYHLNYAVFVRGKPAHVELGPIHAFTFLPWQGPQRLIFGVRLAEIMPAAEGTWTIRFDPESVVLLTDLGAAAAACGLPADELREVILRQAEQFSNSP